MRTGKCWFEKGDFDHFGMCFGCFRAHFGPGGSLKQPQPVISDHFGPGGVSKTAPARHFGPGGPQNSPSTSTKSKMMQTKKMRSEKCWFEKGGFDHFRMCFGCFRAHFGPGGGSLKQHQHVILDPGGP